MWINYTVLWERESILFLDGFAYTLFNRTKTYQMKGNVLSVWHVSNFLKKISTYPFLSILMLKTNTTLRVDVMIRWYFYTIQLL